MAEADAAWDGVAVDADVLISSEGQVGGVSSEAAKKAYPIQNWQDGGWRKTVRLDRQRAFDRGAVEALRQAAEKMRGRSYLAGGAAMELRAMADEWERGSA